MKHSVYISATLRGFTNRNSQVQLLKLYKNGGVLSPTKRQYAFLEPFCQAEARWNGLQRQEENRALRTPGF